MFQDGYCTNIGRSAPALTRPLRILHVAPYAADAWAYGGIPRLLRSLTRGLARRGHYVTICATDACDAASRLRAPSLHAGDGVDVRIFRNVSNRLAYRLQFFLPLGLDTFLRRHAGAFDVAHLHACRNVPGAIAARHLERNGVPYVLAPNGTAPRIERRRLAKRAFDAVAGRRVVSRAARVVAVSEAERRQLAALDVDDASVRVIPNPIDLDEFASPIARGRFRRRIGLGSEPLVLFLGRLSPRKRLDVLLRAFARLARSDARLAIAGNDMGAEAAARSLAHALGLDSRVVFTGLLRDRERLEALADADLVSYPSELEIFGLVPLEAILAGTPVVVSDDCGCGEVIREVGGGRVVAVGDPDALASAIDAMLADTARWRAAAVHAARRVRSSFGEDDVCASLEGVYAEVVRCA